MPPRRNGARSFCRERHDGSGRTETREEGHRDRRLSRLPRVHQETNPGGRGTARNSSTNPVQSCREGEPWAHALSAERKHGSNGSARMFGSRRSNRLDPRTSSACAVTPASIGRRTNGVNNPIRSLEPVFQNCRRRRSHLRALNSFVEAYALCLGLPLACRCGIRYQPRFRGRNSFKKPQASNRAFYPPRPRPPDRGTGR